MLYVSQDSEYELPAITYSARLGFRNDAIQDGQVVKAGTNKEVGLGQTVSALSPPSLLGIVASSLIYIIRPL